MTFPNYIKANIRFSKFIYLGELMSIKFLVILVGLFISSSIAQPQVTFESLLKQALASDQKLQALDLKIQSKEYSISSNQGYPPTEFSLETTNLGSQEYTLLVGQEFQLSNQNKKAQNTLRMEQDVLRSEIALQKSQTEYKLGTLYLEAAFYQDHILYLDTLWVLMKQSSEWIQKTIEVGSGSKLDLMRIKLDMQEVSLQRSRYLAGFKAKIKQVGSLTQSQIPEASKLNFSLKELSLEKNDFTQSSASSLEEKILRKQALVENSKAAQKDVGLFPSLVIEGGITQSVVDNEFYGQLNLGLSIPLFSNTTQTIKAQNTWTKATQKEADHLKKQALSQTAKLILEIHQTQDEVRFIQTEMLENALTVLKEMNHLINQGVFSFLDYQMSRREILRIKNEEFNLLEKLGKAQLELNFITGGTNHVLN